MVGFNYSGKHIAAERRATVEQCAKIAESVAAEAGDGEGEIYIARKIADQIRALLIAPVTNGDLTSG